MSYSEILKRLDEITDSEVLKMSVSIKIHPKSRKVTIHSVSGNNSGPWKAYEAHAYNGMTVS